MKPLYIFLDIDGVLVTANSLLRGWFSNDYEMSEPEMLHALCDPACMENLSELISHIKKRGFKPLIVISSSWRTAYDSPNHKWFREAFGKFAINAVAGVTCTHDPNPNAIVKKAKRQRQIEKWLQDNNVEADHYLIIDDNRDHFKSDIKRLIKCDKRFGFDKLALVEAKLIVHAMLEKTST